MTLQQILLPLILLVPAFPDSAELNVRRMVLCVSGADLHGIFEPVIQKILTLVTQQITSTEKAKSKVKAVLLVGGFGESHYLHKRIRESVAGRPIEVLKSPAGYVLPCKFTISISESL